MKNRKRKLFSPIWMCGLRSAGAVITSVLMLTSQSVAATVDERQPSAAEIVQPVANAYQQLQQALAGPQPKTPLTPDQIAARLDKIFPMLEQAEKQIPRDTFDPQAIIDKVGKDPMKIFEWVRDNTYFVPYRGLLRGDKGVLMDRLGNSLDRAMLLYALLAFVNQRARMVRGTLTEAQANDVLAQVRPFPSFEQRTGSGSSPAATEEFVKQYAQQNHLDPVPIRKALDQLATQQQRMKELVQKRAAAQAAIVASALGSEGANTGAEQHGEQVKAVTDHWWVQWQRGTNWVDFDPTLPRSQPGQSLGIRQARAVFNKLADLPNELIYKVVLRVIIEQLTGGQLREQTVLTGTLQPFELYGVPIRLNNIPIAWPNDETRYVNASDKQAYFTSALLDQKDWVPIILVGQQQIIQSGFNISGEVNANPLAPGMGTAAGGLGQAVGGLLAGAGTRQKSAEAKRTPSVLTSEWIEYEIISPGQPTHTIRREIFDALGPGLRAAGDVPPSELTLPQRLGRGLALMAETRILVQPSQLSPEFVQDVTLQALLTSRPALLTMLHSVDAGDSQQLMEAGGELVSSPTSLYELALARQTSNVHYYFDRPNIISSHRYLDSDTAGDLLLCQAFDIVDNYISTINLQYTTRLEQGVFDTNVEAIIAARPSANKAPVNGNAAEMFRGPSLSSSSWKIIRTDDDANLKDLRFSRNDLARAQQDLRAGYVIFARKTAAEPKSVLAWWRVDPRTGQTIGIGSRGWGQAVETQLVRRAYVVPVVFIGLTLACFAGHAAGGRQSQEKWDTRVWIICPVAAGVEIYGGAAMELGRLVASLISNLVLIGYSQ